MFTLLQKMSLLIILVKYFNLTCFFTKNLDRFTDESQIEQSSFLEQYQKVVEVIKIHT